MEPISIAAAISALVGVGGSIFGLYQKVRQGRIEASLEQYDITLKSIIAAIELYAQVDPERAAKLKATIRKYAEATGAERALLAAEVRNVIGLLEDFGALDPNQTSASAERAAINAIGPARNKWKAKAAAKRAGALLILVGASALFAGCATLPQAPGVSSFYFEAEDGAPAGIVVVLPKEVSSDPDDAVVSRDPETGQVTAAFPIWPDDTPEDDGLQD